MNKNTWIRMGAGSLLAMILATGCSQGAGKFAADADKLCAQSNAQIKTLAEPTTVAQIGDEGLALNTETISLVKRLESLGVPGAAEVFVKDLKAAGESAKKMSSAANAGEFPAIETAVAETSTAYKKADDSARALGLNECAKNEADVAAKVAGSSPAILKNAYLAQADSFCAAITEGMFNADFPDTEAGLVQLFTTMESLVSQAVLKVKAVAPPEAEKQALAPILADMDALTKQYGAVRDAIKAKDRANIGRLLDETAFLEVKQSQSADRYGFRDCGTG